MQSCHHKPEVCTFCYCLFTISMTDLALHLWLLRMRQFSCQYPFFCLFLKKEIAKRKNECDVSELLVDSQRVHPQALQHSCPSNDLKL